MNTKSTGDTNKTLSVEECLDKIRPYLKNIINNLKKSDTWKVQLTVANNLISFIDNDEECIMHSKSGNIGIMITKTRYQNNLELMKGSEFVFYYVHLLYYKCHKTNPNHGGSCADSPNSPDSNWKGINFPSEKDDRQKCKENNVTIALNVLHANSCLCFKISNVWKFQNINEIVENKLFF